MNGSTPVSFHSVRARSLCALADPPVSADRWHFSALRGRLTELSEELPSGALSIAAELLAQAQAGGEPAAWIAVDRSIFYPPDFDERGIDLAALSVIRVPAGAKGTLRAGVLAAEWLLRSGAFGLVVLDAGSECRVSEGSLGRLARLAERSACALLFLTRKRTQDPSLGSIISLRGAVAPIRSRRRAPALLACGLRTVKDKRSSPGGSVVRYFDAPRGLH